MTTHNSYALNNYAAIRFAGSDAEDFLNGQLTNDTSSLPIRGTQLSAMCNPKGRVLAILHLSRTDEGIDAVVPSELAQSVIDDLKRYVFRAKVTMDLLDDPVEGVMMPNGAPILRVADTGSAGADPGDADPSHSWEELCVARGYPEVYAATSGEYVAQMLNLDLLGGISFDKGCYTGQEIVARTQNLGRIKRRMFLYSGDALSLAPGDPLHVADKRAGSVVRSTRVGNETVLLAVIRVEHHLASLTTNNGATFSYRQLPYAVVNATT